MKTTLEALDGCRLSGFFVQVLLTFLLMLLYDSLNLVVELSSGLLRAIAQEKGSGEFCTATVGLC